MSDTSHLHAPAGTEPTEGDGVNYRGIVWFVAILAGTTFACQLLMWGMFAFMDRQVIRIIMSLTNGPTDPTASTEFTDWQAVDKFAHRVSNLGST